MDRNEVVVLFLMVGLLLGVFTLLTYARLAGMSPSGHVAMRTAAMAGGDDRYRIEPPDNPLCSPLPDGSGIIVRSLLRTDGTSDERVLRNRCTDDHHLIRYVCLPTSSLRTGWKTYTTHEISCADYQFCNDSAGKCTLRYLGCRDTDSSAPNPVVVMGNVSVEDVLTGEILTFTDYCDDDGVHEYSCDPDRGYVERVYPLPEGYECSDGVLVARTTCTDPDGGINPFNASRVVVTYPDGSTTEYADRPVWFDITADEITGNWLDACYHIHYNATQLTEYYCNETTGECGNVTVDCESLGEYGIINCVRKITELDHLGNAYCLDSYCVANQCTHVADRINKEFLYNGTIIYHWYPCPWAHCGEADTLYYHFCSYTQAALYLGIYNGELFGDPMNGWNITEGFELHMDEPGFVVERGYFEDLDPDDGYVCDPYFGTPPCLIYWEQYECHPTDDNPYHLTRKVEQCEPGAVFSTGGCRIIPDGPSDDDDGKGPSYPSYEEWMNSTEHAGWLEVITEYAKSNGYKFEEVQTPDEFYEGNLGYLITKDGKRFPIKSKAYRYYVADTISPWKQFPLGVPADQLHYLDTVDPDYIKLFSKDGVNDKYGYFKKLHQRFKEYYLKRMREQHQRGSGGEPDEMDGSKTQSETEGKEGIGSSSGKGKESLNTTPFSPPWELRWRISLYCHDSDDRDPYTAGKLSWRLVGPISRLLNLTLVQYSDTCVNATYYREYYCEHDKPTYDVFACPDGYVCSDGRCVQEDEVEYSCVDSDGGINLTTSGTVNVYHGDSLVGSWSDACIDEHSLREYYCASPYDSEPREYDYIATQYDWSLNDGYLVNCSDGALNETGYLCYDLDYQPDTIGTYKTPSYVLKDWPISPDEYVPDSCEDDGRQLAQLNEMYCGVDIHLDRDYHIAKVDHALCNLRGICYCNYSEDDIEHADKLRCSEEFGYGPPHYFHYFNCTLAARNTTIWFYDDDFWGGWFDPMAPPPSDRSSNGGNITFGWPSWRDDAWYWDVQPDRCIMDWETAQAYLYVYRCDPDDPTHNNMTRTIYRCRNLCDYMFPIQECEIDEGKGPVTDTETIKRLDDLMSSLDEHVGVRLSEVKDRFGPYYYKDPDFDDKFLIWKTERYIKYMREHGYPDKAIEANMKFLMDRYGLTRQQIEEDLENIQLD